MPSRRLPRTDDARTEAINACYDKYNATPPSARLITATQFGTLSTARTTWGNATNSCGPLLQAQATATEAAVAAFETCQRLVSHFIQVFNLGVERAVFPAADRAFYQLPVSSSDVPALTSKADVALWAGRIAIGESQRQASGGTPMAMPDAAQVDAASTALAALDTAQSIAKDAYDAGQEACSALRPPTDALILDLWDTIEYNLRGETPASSLRRRAREWGVIYRGEEEEEPVPPIPPAP